MVTLSQNGPANSEQVNFDMGSVSAIRDKSELQKSRQLDTRALASNFALFRSR